MKQAGLGPLIGAIVFIVLFFGTEIALGPRTCLDGWASDSIGMPGACSWHGGVNNSRYLLLPPYFGISVGIMFWVWGRQRSRLAAQKVQLSELDHKILTELLAADDHKASWRYLTAKEGIYGGAINHLQDLGLVRVKTFDVAEAEVRLTSLGLKLCGNAHSGGAELPSGHHDPYVDQILPYDPSQAQNAVLSDGNELREWDEARHNWMGLVGLAGLLILIETCSSAPNSSSPESVEETFDYRRDP
jgi:hypothetical protein